VIRVSFVRQLTSVSRCGEKHSTTTQRTSTRTSPVVSFDDSLPLSPRVSRRSLTTHTAPTPSSASLQDSRHCRSSLNKVWRESVAKPRPTLKHSSGHVTSSHRPENRTGESASPENWVDSAATRRAAWLSRGGAAHRYNQWLVRINTHTYANMQIKRPWKHYAYVLILHNIVFEQISVMQIFAAKMIRNVAMTTMMMTLLMTSSTASQQQHIIYCPVSSPNGTQLCVDDGQNGTETFEVEKLTSCALNTMSSQAAMFNYKTNITHRQCTLYQTSPSSYLNVNNCVAYEVPVYMSITLFI